MTAPAESLPSVAPQPPTTAASRVISIAVASALLMEFIDSTALSTALPTLARVFHTDPIHLKLALTSYILTLAVIAPASGWVADRYGPRRVFLSAMAVFLVASVMCGLSHSLAELVVFRILQGIGGAMMTPVGRLIVIGSSPRENLVAAMSWYTMPAMIGPLMGPPVAGIILHFASWPFIFFVNVPVGILGMIAVTRLVPPLRQPDPGRFDSQGFVLLAIGLTAMVGAAETVGVSLAPAWVQIAAVIVAVLAGVAYWLHSRKTPKPVLALTLLRFPTFRTSLVGTLLLRLGLGATPFLMPLLLQVGLGWSPLKAGLVSIAQTCGAALVKPVAPAIMRRWGFRQVLLTTSLIAGFAVAAPGVFRAYTPIPVIILSLMMAGFLRSLQITATNTIAYADVPQTAISRASTVATVVQQVSMSLGISFGALMLSLARGSGGQLTPDRFLVPFIGIGAMTMATALFYRRLAPDAGSTISGHGAKA